MKSRSSSSQLVTKQLAAMNAIPLALKDVDYAFGHLEFAIKLMYYVEAGNIDRGKFDAGVTLLLERENVSIPAGTFGTLDSIVLPTQAIFGVSFGVTAMVLNAAFEATGVGQKPESNSPDDLLRSLVYMIRCAFAHNPAMPTWEVRGPYSRDLELVLEGESIRVRLAELHGKDFDYSHIGGLANWYRIRRAVEAVLNRATPGDRPLPPAAAAERR